MKRSDLAGLRALSCSGCRRCQRARMCPPGTRPALYENPCVVCHTQKFPPRASHAINVQDLRRIVSSWAKEQNLRWSQADIEDVVQYLDRTYYQLAR